MRTYRTLLLSSLAIFLSSTAFADNNKKQQQQTNNAPPTGKQQQMAAALTGHLPRYGSQQSGHYATQQQSGHYATQGQSNRYSPQQSGHYATQQSGHYATQHNRSVRQVNGDRQNERNVQTRSVVVPRNGRVPSNIRASRVYNFQGPHRGGGRYVDGRLIGRYASDRVYIDHQWYVWEPVPVYIDGYDGYGWAVADGPAVEEIEPVIIGTGPDYYIVEVNNVSSRVSREEFYRTYPRYVRAHHMQNGPRSQSVRGRSNQNSQTVENGKHRKNQ